MSAARPGSECRWRVGSFTRAAVEQSPGKRRRASSSPPGARGCRSSNGRCPARENDCAELPAPQVLRQLLEPAPVALGGPEVLRLVAPDALPPLDRQQPATATTHQGDRMTSAVGGLGRVRRRFTGAPPPRTRSAARTAAGEVISKRTDDRPDRRAPRCRSAPPASRCVAGRSACATSSPTTTRSSTVPRRLLAPPDVVQARATASSRPERHRRVLDHHRRRRPPAARAAPGAGACRSRGSAGARSCTPSPGTGCARPARQATTAPAPSAPDHPRVGPAVDEVVADRRGGRSTRRTVSAPERARSTT